MPRVFFESPEAKAERAAESAAQSLGWPTSTAPREGIGGTSYTVTPYGGYEDDPGFGNNSEGCCAPAVLLPLIFLAAFVKSRN